jgi:hypothetical protein
VHTQPCLAAYRALVDLGHQLFSVMVYSMLAAIHFWLHNVGLPLMLAGLALALRGETGFGVPLAGLGSRLALTGISSLAVNIWRNGHRTLNDI